MLTSPINKAGKQLHNSFFFKNRYLKENVYLMLMELKSPLEKFQRREFYRFECVMDIQYMTITEEEVGIDDITELKEHHRLTYPEDLVESAVAVDISGGGIRFVSDLPAEEGSFILIHMPPGRLCKHLLLEMYYLR